MYVVSSVFVLHLLVVSEMTYTVSSGTLNSSIPYHSPFTGNQVLVTAVEIKVKSVAWYDHETV